MSNNVTTCMNKPFNIYVSSMHDNILSCLVFFALFCLSSYFTERIYIYRSFYQ